MIQKLWSRWRPIWACLWILVGLTVAGPGVADRLATVLQTSAWRQVTDPVYPRPASEDGSVVVSITGDRPLDLVGTNPDFQRVDTHSFATRFAWNWEGPRTVTVVDDLGDETTVVVTPDLATPFLPLSHSIPVLHISCDSTALWDPETGIYTTGNDENFAQRGPQWEREARFEYYLPGWGRVVDEPIGLRINGGYGRYYHQKGLRFYFDNHGDETALEHPFFSDGPVEFERLIIRASRYDDYCINSNFAEGLFADLGHLASRYKFVAVYLNREYWGAYSLRERLDHEFFLRTWDLGYGGLNLIKDGETQHGDGQGWWDFLASFGQVSNPQDDQWLAWVCRNLDLASYIDWQIINMYCAPGDNGFAWNVAVFQTGDHPWRLVMWDEDTLLRTADLNANLFRFLTARNEAEWTMYQAPADHRLWTPQAQQWLTMFRTLLGNDDFRALFRSRLEHVLGGAMTPEALIARVDALALEQSPEIPAHADRWEGFRADWYASNLDRTRQWLTDRRSIFLAQADSFYDEFDLPPWSGDYTGLVINEFLASNQTGALDESGDTEDWVELYNGGPATVNLTGMFLTDDLSQTHKWEFPAVLLPAGERLVVWCDDEPGQGPLHATFKLKASGEEVGLFAPLAFGNTAIDTYVYGPQTSDVSLGRISDGNPVWDFLDPPTLGMANDDTVSVPDLPPSAVMLAQNYPNPFNPGTTLAFELPHFGRVRIQVFDVRGHLVRVLVDETRAPGNYDVSWQGVDGSGRPVPSGLYFARMEFAGLVKTRTMTLVR